MKLKFKNQDFQTAAAVVDLFKGQSRRTDIFTIVNEMQTVIDEGFGVRNALAE